MNNRSVSVFFLSLIVCFTTHAMDNNKKILTQSALIALEGIDCAEKSTLAESVCKKLTQRGFDAILTKEPVNRHLGSIIIPESTHHKIIICDRLVDSSVAYQNYDQAPECTKTQSSNKYFMNKKADFTVFLDTPIQTILAHCNKRNDLSADKKEKLLRNFRMKSLLLYSHRTDVVLIDETDEIEELAKALENWLREHNFCS